MKDINIFCFGFGLVAKNFISILQTENFKINLSSTSIDLTNKSEINNIKFNRYQFN